MRTYPTFVPYPAVKAKKKGGGGKAVRGRFSEDEHPRDEKSGKFIVKGTPAYRKAERENLVTLQKGDREKLKAKQAKETSKLATKQRKEKKSAGSTAEKTAMTKRHKEEKTALKDKQKDARDKLSTKHQKEKTALQDAHKAETSGAKTAKPKPETKPKTETKPKEKPAPDKPKPDAKPKPSTTDQDDDITAMLQKEMARTGESPEQLLARLTGQESPASAPAPAKPADETPKKNPTKKKPATKQPDADAETNTSTKPAKQKQDTADTSPLTHKNDPHLGYAEGRPPGFGSDKDAQEFHKLHEQTPRNRSPMARYDTTPADQAMTDRFGNHNKGVKTTKDEQAALTSYQDEGYRDMNNRLWSKKPDKNGALPQASQEDRDLQTLLLKHEAPHDMIVTRQQGSDHPSFAAFSKAKEGSTYNANGFDSSSVDPGYEWGDSRGDKRITIDYAVPKGAKGVYMNGVKGHKSQYPDEREWLHPANSTWRISKKTVDKDGNVRVLLELAEQRDLDGKRVYPAGTTKALTVTVTETDEGMTITITEQPARSSLERHLEHEDFAIENTETWQTGHQFYEPGEEPTWLQESLTRLAPLSDEEDEDDKDDDASPEGKALLSDLDTTITDHLNRLESLLDEVKAIYGDDEATKRRDNLTPQNDEAEQKLRKRAGNKCERSGCGSTRNLVVHHLRKPHGKQSMNNPENTFLLCNSCHQEWHRAPHGLAFADWLKTDKDET